MNFVRISASALAVAVGLSAGGAWAQDEGDAAAGEKVYNKCRACHSLEAGDHKVGPALASIVGRTAGTAEGYNYSEAMAGSGITWDEANLDAYLADPRGFMAGNKMTFPGLKDEQDRADVIAYLKAN